MRKRQVLFSLLLYLLVCFPGYLQAQTQDAIQERLNNVSKERDLTVAIAGTAPFVMTDSITHKPEGIAVNIWKDLAASEGWAFQYKKFGTVDAALKAVENGNADLAIGPISITSERVKRLSFSQPYYQSSLSIVSRMDEISFWSRITSFFSLKFLYAAGGFVLILAIVGLFLWLAEHKRNDEFSPKIGKGIGHGMWLAIVTMSTVGYGDMAAKTALGRIITGTWIVIAILFATTMVAGISSSLTLSGMGSSSIHNIEELQGKKTATISDSPAVAFIREHKSTPVQTESLADAMVLLENKKVDAVIYDRPQLLYYIKKHKDEDLYISKAEYYKQGYGFAFPQPKKNLVNNVNLSLLNLAENQKVKAIVDDYLGGE